MKLTSNDTIGMSCFIKKEDETLTRLKIKRARETAGLSVKEFCKRLKTNPRKYKHYEDGKDQPHQYLNLVYRCNKELKVGIDYLLNRSATFFTEDDPEFIGKLDEVTTGARIKILAAWESGGFEAAVEAYPKAKARSDYIRRYHCHSAKKKREQEDE